MIIVVISGILLLGLVVGWYGHKASLRIARWGQALLEFDRDVQLEYADYGMDDYAEPVVLEVTPVSAEAADARTKYVGPIPVSH